MITEILFTHLPRCDKISTKYFRRTGVLSSNKFNERLELF